MLPSPVGFGEPEAMESHRLNVDSRVVAGRVESFPHGGGFQDIRFKPLPGPGLEGCGALIFLNPCNRSIPAGNRRGAGRVGRSPAAAPAFLWAEWRPSSSTMTFMVASAAARKVSSRVFPQAEKAMSAVATSSKNS